MSYYVRESKCDGYYKQTLYLKGEELYSRCSKETTYSKIYGGAKMKKGKLVKGKNGYDIVKEIMIRDLNNDPTLHKDFRFE